MRTLQGIKERERPLRDAAYLIHCSLIPQKDRVDIEAFWLLPLDENNSKMELLAKQQEYMRLKNSLNGNRATTG